MCYVAGIRTDQIESLKEHSITPLADLAELDDVPAPAQGSKAALERIRDQARIQRQGRSVGKPVWQLKEPFDAEHGFTLLPEPTPDDIFLDFEGSHFAEHGVRARFLLAHMMEFHRREDKASWWDYYRVLGLEESECADVVAGVANSRCSAPIPRSDRRFTSLYR